MHHFRLHDQRWFVRTPHGIAPVYGTEDIRHLRSIRDRVDVIYSETFTAVGWVRDQQKMPSQFKIVPMTAQIPPVDGIGRGQLARMLRMWRKIDRRKIRRTGPSQFTMTEVTRNGRQAVAMFRPT